MWIAFGLLGVIGGAIAVDLGYRRGDLGKASQNWVEVEGVVDTSWIETYGKTNSNYEAHAIYRYQYDSLRFRGTQIRFASPPGGSLLDGWFEAFDFLENHLPGTKVTVYVDPDYPGHSVLLRGVIPSGVRFPMIWGSVAVLAGLWAIWSALRWRRKEK